ncbi:MAG TPA: hypothetical protein VJ770_02765 [Stellaceae bacterium]|nr:hypothetical protein [Stellaceae bacterium]
MLPIIWVEEWDVDRRLGELDLSREELIEVIRACVAAHGGCTDNDPPSAKGWEAWRWGVRRLREIYRPAGFDKDETGGLSTTVNRARRYRIAVVNTDDATGLPGDRIPQNRNKKGPASEQATTINQQLLPGYDWPRRTPDGQEPVSDLPTWHLCVYIEGDEVRAELSLLVEFKSGFFTECSERIILIGQDDWQKLDFGDSSGDLGPEFDVDVRRK